ncbi:hypothetical protein IP92_02906 [Pseudoduganella flava]|uniref:Uncharacterized protein n=1 Tax=Pseudoduganella flava TaxID=871742 RepID=A0A562PQ18_9BURK|nr:hypothetical protein [Pseudoduganella flava]QGZ37743.1 hypothetical protein GO485_00825 [Pseudoduganella flava]TWI46547.1 hypothetical protein IP92_02906 [Pseudoduganella flava]
MNGKAMLAPLLAAAALGGGTARGEALDQVQMLLALDAPPADGHVRLRIELTNRGKTPVLVPRAIAAMDRLLGNVFIVKDAVTGETVQYEGPMVKRGPLTAADYLALQPGQRHQHVIDIGPAYGFRPGTHTYSVSYAGHYLTDAKALAGTGAPGIPLTAPPFTFTYTR